MCVQQKYEKQSNWEELAPRWQRLLSLLMYDKVNRNLPSCLLLVLLIISRSKKTLIIMLHWFTFQRQNIIKDLSHAVEFILP